MKKFVMLIGILSFSSAYAETIWTCDGMVTNYFPKDILKSAGGAIQTESSSLKSADPRLAAIKVLDQAFDSLTQVQDVCKVQKTLDLQHKDQWPDHYAWIQHWKVVNGKMLPDITYYPNVGSELFTDILNQIMSDEITFPFTKDSTIVGCFYECTQK